MWLLGHSNLTHQNAVVLLLSVHPSPQGEGNFVVLVFQAVKG
ncbi:hypothetical protein C900_00599 [Fulvivirga imtechensis AK7]|uniref:Uncharacterized protein n=1 Tax=Fulvivirga imtechensis AK7 TaxID=1237149 RepID=L8JHH4_9BACT|nr:hypothetical protein C900_00599 [Fulvivirga imtechensis AK7]